MPIIMTLSAEIVEAVLVGSETAVAMAVFNCVRAAGLSNVLVSTGNVKAAVVVASYLVISTVTTAPVVLALLAASSSCLSCASKLSATIAPWNIVSKVSTVVSPDDAVRPHSADVNTPSAQLDVTLSLIS